MKQLGDFEIVREIGRGGMGIVYESRQISLNRPVALKVLAGGFGLTPIAIRRFHLEAEAAAGLHHPHIVPIYFIGEFEGTHYYAMEFIEGRSLDKVIEQRAETSNKSNTQSASLAEGESSARTRAYNSQVRPPQHPADDGSSTANPLTTSFSYDDIARLLADVADALHYAHQRGVIQRDIKPSNLLLSTSTAIAAPMSAENSAHRIGLSISDFGLARLLEQPGVTLSGEFVGTPAYMSPEQIAAGRIAVDHRTDVYSLGATLYEWTTLRRPFQAVGRDQLLAKIQRDDPVAPRAVVPEIPRDLETICLKAMEKDPSRRYQTAGEMADDLRRFVNRFAISARRARPIERLRKWTRRHPSAAIAAILLFVLTVVTAVLLVRGQGLERRRIADKRQSSLERALLLTLATDADGAERSVEEAKRWGASAAELRMLEGQIDLWFRYENQQAVEHLLEAVQLDPTNVSARSLLAFAYLSNGQLDRFEDAMREVRRLTPQTAEDYLHLGRVVVYKNREQGLQMIDEAIRRRPSPFALFLRAGARADAGNDLGDNVLAVQAVDDVTAAKSLMPENPSVLDISAYAHLSAAGILQAAGQLERGQALLAQGAKDAASLEEWLDRHPEVAFNCAFYRLHLDQLDGTIDFLRRAARQRPSPSTTMALANALYRERQFDLAAEAIDRFLDQAGSDPMLECCLVYCLWEIPEQRERARATLDRLVSQALSGLPRHFALMTLLFTGDSATATKGYREMLDDSRSSSSWFGFSDSFVRTLVEFGAGTATEKDLTIASKTSRWSGSAAHFLIAMRQLCDGNRDGAQASLRRCAECDIFFGPEAWWSRAFLTRMASDPLWPPWIAPQTEPAEKSQERGH